MDSKKAVPKIAVEPVCSRTLGQKPASLKALSKKPDSDDDCLVVGTYQSSYGAICVLNSTTLDTERDIPLSGGVFRFEQLQGRPGQPEKIVAALTSGQLVVVDLQNGSPSSVEYSPKLSEGMLLDCSTTSNKLLCSGELGNLFFLDLEDFQLIKSWCAHMPNLGKQYYGMSTSNVWSCCFLNEQDQTCASGGDEATVKVWDLRCPSIGFRSSQMANECAHSAGVVFLSSAISGQLLFTGSYDDHLRVFDLRSFQSPLAAIKLSGGVWCAEATKTENIDGEKLLLASCMYGGWCLVRFTSSSTFELVHTCDKNDSNDGLVYGATHLRDSRQVHGPIDDQNLLVASCTFNDSEVRLERVHFGGTPISVPMNELKISE